jgi:hypothetical protein
MSTLCGGDEPIMVICRHQHELTTAMPRNFDRLPLSAVLTLSELNLRRNSKAVVRVMKYQSE